jgi:hypothetical protein
VIWGPPFDDPGGLKERTMFRPKLELALAHLVLGVALAAPCGGQVLETETARLRLPGAVQAGLNYEFQTSSEGHESAVPFLFEYGFTDRFELAVEPVAATRIRPNAGESATGFGDTEVTLTYLVRRETGSFPALAVAGEVKFPTARNSLIGTGEPDYAAYLIASKRFGRLDTSFNAAYTKVGQPPGPEMAGPRLSNTIGGAVAGMYAVNKRFRIYGEVLATTAASGGGPEAPLSLNGTLPPEAAGEELVGTIGGGVYLNPKLFLSLGVSYDNTHAILFRPGITFRSK